MAHVRELITSHAAHVRIERARAWLAAHAPAAEVVVVGAHADAAAELVRTSLEACARRRFRLASSVLRAARGRAGGAAPGGARRGAAVAPCGHRGRRAGGAARARATPPSDATRPSRTRRASRAPSRARSRRCASRALPSNAVARQDPDLAALYTAYVAGLAGRSAHRLARRARRGAGNGQRRRRASLARPAAAAARLQPAARCRGRARRRAGRPRARAARDPAGQRRAWPHAARTYRRAGAYAAARAR